MTSRRAFVILGYVSILAVALILRYKPSYFAAQLLPLPDALEYSVSGISLFKTGTFAMYVNHVAYPPNYPFGFPLLLTPAFAIFGPVAHYAIWAAFFYSMALLVIAMFITRRLFGHGAALVAGLVLAVARQQIVTSQEIMSDAASAALVLLAAHLILRAADGAARHRYLLLAGFLAGLVVSMRLGDSALALALAVAVAILLRHSLRRVVTGLLAFGLGATPWAVALLAYNWQTFGNVFETGYSYWNPFFDNTSSVFNLSYLVTSSAPDTLPTIRYYGAMLLGLDWWFWLPPFALAIALGVAAIARQGSPEQKRGALVLGILAVANIGIYGIYNFQYPRFLILASTALTIIGSAGTIELVRIAVTRRSDLLAALTPGVGAAPLLSSKRARAVCGIVLLLLVAGIMFNGTDDVRNNYIFRTQIRGVQWYEYPWRYDVVRFLDQQTPEDAIIISALPGPYVEHYLIKDTRRVYMPIKHKGVYHAGKMPARQWIVADENADLLETAIRQGTPVCLIDDPLTREQTTAMDLLRSRFAFRETGTLTVPRWGELTAMTLYRLQLPAQ